MAGVGLGLDAQSICCAILVVVVVDIVVTTTTAAVIRVPINLLRKRLLARLLITGLCAVEGLLMLLLRVLRGLLLAHLVEVHRQRVIAARVEYRARGVGLSRLERRGGRGL